MNGYKKIIAFKVNDVMSGRIETMRRMYGTSKSQIIRRALNMYYEHFLKTDLPLLKKMHRRKDEY